MSEDTTNSGENGKPIRRRSGPVTRAFTGAYTALSHPIIRVGGWWANRSGRIPEQSLTQRWGDLDGTVGSAALDRPIWIHAASMGEVAIAATFAERLRDRSIPAFLSVVTETGYRQAGDTLSATLPTIRAPFDLPAALNKIFDSMSPRAVVIVETEWWPNLLGCARERGIPVYSINGRLSPGAYRRYLLGRAYWRSVLGAIDRFYMRAEDDAHRLRKLGIDETRIEVAGSLKTERTESLPRVMDDLLGVLNPDGAPVVLAGSTRPGEERILLDVFSRLLATIPNLRLWLTPRHPHRFRDVARLIDKSGHSWCAIEREPLREESRPSASVVLIDRMGVLASLYRHCSVAFVGGSLFPLGGHNPLEPVAAGVPVVFGPYMESQSPLSDQLVEAGLAKVAHDAPSLTQAFRRHLENPIDPAELERRREAFFSQLAGIPGRVADDLLRRMDKFHANQTTAQ